MFRVNAHVRTLDRIAHTKNDTLPDLPETMNFTYCPPPLDVLSPP